MYIFSDDYFYYNNNNNNNMHWSSIEEVSSQITFPQSCSFDSLSKPHTVMAFQPTPGDKPREGISEKHGNRANMAASNLTTYIITTVLQFFLSLAHCCAASTVILLLPKTTITPFIQPNLVLPHTSHQHPSSHVVTLHLMNIHFLFLNTYTPYLWPHTTPLIQKLLHTDTWSHLSPSYIAQHTVQGSLHSTPFICSVS